MTSGVTDGHRETFSSARDPAVEDTLVERYPCHFRRLDEAVTATGGLLLERGGQRRRQRGFADEPTMVHDGDDDLPEADPYAPDRSRREV